MNEERARRQFFQILAGVMVLLLLFLMVALTGRAEETVDGQEAKTEAASVTESLSKKNEDVPKTIIASGYCGDKGDNVKWQLDEEGTLTISGNGAMQDYELSYDSNLNREMAKTPWMDNWSKITQIIVEKGIAKIGDGSFVGCTYLTNVNISDSVANIGNYAFWDCSNLIDINIPLSAEEMGRGVFYGCAALTDIEIPNGVTRIGSQFFSGCTNLKNVVLPQSLTSIGSWAFSDCSSLKNIELPDKLEEIGQNAFENCSSLTNIKLPESLKDISIYVFKGCSSLESMIIPEGIDSVPLQTFYYCSSLKKVSIPLSVTSIGSQAFYRSGITDIYYAGNEAQWNSILGDKPNATIHYNCVFFTDGKNCYLNVGESITLLSEKCFETSQTITWHSNNESVATVENGVVTAKAAGETIITALAGDYSASCEVTVNESVLVYGDANGDGIINGMDILLLRQYMVNFDDQTGTSSIKVERGADANGDGTVDGKDVVLLRQYMANYDDETGTSSVVLGSEV